MNEPPGARMRVALDRPDHGGILPRAGRPGRAALHRQHLPVRAGRLRGVRPARAHAVAGGRPADPRDGDGPAAGADHVHPRGLGDLGPGHLRAGHDLTDPAPGLGVRAPQRDDDTVPGDFGEGDLPGRGPARLHLHDPRRRLSWARSTSRSRTRCARSCSATRSSRTSSPSSASTSCRTRTRSRSSGRARSSASCRSRSSWPSSSPACPGKYVQVAGTLLPFKEIIQGVH